MFGLLKRTSFTTRNVCVMRRRNEGFQYVSLSSVIQCKSQRFYSQNSNTTSAILNRLQSGDITKSEVVRLIINNESLKSRVNDLERLTRINSNVDYNYSPKINNSPTHFHQPPPSVLYDIHPHASNIMATPPLSSSRGTITSLGSKSNPVYMKRQTTFKEFIFSLFPFLFIFWMLGGFDVIKNSKQGGVGGGMFGKNYSEWDETDWEDEELEEKSATGESLLKNGQSQMSTNEERALDGDKDKLKEKDKETEVDLRSEFFRRLGVNINKDPKSTHSSNVDSKTDNDGEVMFNNKKKKHKRARFRDVCGNEEAKMDLQDLVDYLKNPQKYQQMGCKLPKGVLLAGPPGTGKTLMARALAGEAGVPFFATNGSSFDEIFVGVGVMRVKRLFERAKEKSPCIVFIDEIDAIANTRMQMGTAHSSDSLNALLSEMDGFEQNAGIIVIAATNMPDRLDHALVRPGRFDRKVYVQLPDAKARKEIIELYLKNRQDDDVNLELLVSDIAGFSGAELESMVNIASMEAVKQAKTKISMAHLIEAKEIISMGRARNIEMSPEVKRVTAYHESGHAIVSLYTKGSKPIYKATILPRGPALGFVASSNSDEYLSTKEALLAQLDICMGGRASEAIFSGSTQITTGASSDFNQATQIATAMVCQYGMSPKVGHVYYPVDQLYKLSPELQNLINTEVKRLLDESFQRATHLILDHREQLEKVAQELLQKETLSGDEIKTLIKWHESHVREPTELYITQTVIPKTEDIKTRTRNDSNNNGNNTNNGKKTVGETMRQLTQGGLLNPSSDLAAPEL